MLKVFMHGRLTRDPELRVTPKGTSVASFAIASNRQFKDDAGTVHENVDYLEIQAWGKLGEVIAKHLKKGSEFVGTGELRQERWEDKQTKAKRSAHQVNLEDFEFAGSKVRSDGSEEEQAATPSEAVAAGR